MSTLLNLKLTAQQKPTQANSVVVRRQKLLGRLAQQIELARAQFSQKDVQEKVNAADIYAFIIDRLRAYRRATA